MKYAFAARFAVAIGVLALSIVTPNRVAAQAYGSSILVVGEQLLVTEPTPAAGADEAAPQTIYVYEHSGEGWVQAEVLQAPDSMGGDYFGRSVVMDGDRILIGATGVSRVSDSDSDGAMYAFRQSMGTWEFESEFAPEQGEASAFGRFASRAGDLLAVSALGHGVGGGVFLFRRDSDGEWVEEAVLTPSDPAEVQEMAGWGVDTDGERVILGAIGGEQAPGKAYVFARTETGEWVEEAQLELEEAQPSAAVAAGREISVSVAIMGGHALFGLPGADDGAGVVLMYSLSSDGTWVRDGQLVAFDRQPGAGFGASFAFGPNEIWVGAPGADTFGAFYILSFDEENGRYAAASKVHPGPGTDVGDGFGSRGVTFGDGFIAVGQPWDDGGLGSVVILEEQDGTWLETDKLYIAEERTLAGLSDVGCDDTGMADQFTCNQVDILSFMPLDEIGGTDRGIETNDVWGWTDPETGREYALVGRTDGTAFIDITDPGAPVYLGSVAKTPGSRTSSWRDIKVYDNHAFIVADNAAEHGMQVFDLTRLRGVSAPEDFEPDAVYDGVTSSHNIVINEETGTAYSVGSSGPNSCGGGYHMIDISTPADPVFLTCYGQTGVGRGANFSYTHDAQCVVYNGPDTEHVGKEICLGSNVTNLAIADVTDPQHPVSLSTAAYPNVQYAHQGWLTEDHRFFYMNDEGDEGWSARQAAETGEEPPIAATRTLIWDVTDLDDPILVEEHLGETFTIDHNLYIVGDLMYQSNYVSGLRVLDISDRENPREVGFFDTVPWDESVVFDGSWSNYPFFESGTIVVSSGKEGVFFLRFRRPELVP